MKSKITKIQILLKKGITLALATMLLAGPIAYATTSLDDNYLQGSFIDKILYGQIGSTAKEIEEYLEDENNPKTTLYITNETQLRALAEYVNSGNSCEGKKIILLNDIELDTEKEWIPIGRTESRFEGIFDGNGYTVKGIRFYRNDKTYSELTDVGFFGYIENATIQNVVIDDSKFGLQYNFPEDINDNFLWNKYDSLGALVGTSRLSNVINCKTTNSVDVNGSMNVGGIVGLTYQSTVKRCENNANATGILYVGGISGRTEGSLTGIKADTQVDFSKVDTTNGVRAAKILECINNGEVYVQLEAVGGITGTLEKFSIVQKCVNYGKVNLGNSTEINEAYCEGYTSQNAGGIVGWTSTRNDAANNKIVSAIDGCINYGSVIGYRDVGGLVGQLGGESGGIIILKDSINYTTDVSAYVTDEKKYTVGITKDGLIDSSAAYDGNFRVLLKGIVEKKLTSPGLIAGLLGAKLGENETLWYKYPEAGYIAGEVSCWGLDSSNSNSYINDPEVIVYNNYYVSNNGTDSLYSDVYDGKASNKISISGYEHQSSDEVMRAYGKIFDRVIGVYSKNNDGTYTLNSADYKTLFHSNGIETTNETTGETTITNETTIVSDENLNSYAPYLLKTESTTESSSDSLQLKYNLFNITTDNSGYTTSSTVNDKVLNIVKNNSAEGYVEEDNKYTISLDNDSNNNKLTQTIDSNNDLKVDYTIETEGNKTNLGVGDTITVTAKFNKYFETSEGTSYIPVLKINNEYEMTYKNVTDYTTTITYTYTIKDGDNFKVDELNITLAEGIYLVTSEGSTEISSSITANTVVTSNIVIDTMNPIINTKVYVENELATERYTAGKEILIEVTTSEEIQGDYTLPQIQVSFSESGEGRYNYSSDSGNVGYAKCKEAKINLNGTTTWIYSYQIQEGDEGYISIEYKSGEIKDLSGNVTEVKDLEIPIESKNQIKVSDIVFDISKDVKLSYKIYRNGTEVSYDNSLKKFDSGDKIKVVAIFNKAIYTQYGETASGTSSIKALTKEDAPTLELDDISFSCDNVSVTNYKTEITYSYTLTSDMKATMLKKLNIETYTYYYTDEDQTIENTNDNNSSNVTVKAKTISTDLSGLNLYVDNLGVENDIGDIYADTTAPTVTITANKSNPTNANEITYTFEFSEKVEGFDATDITVNGGEKAKDADEIVEFDEVKGEEGKEYTLVVNPTIENGNEGELQVIVESGACKDLVALDNVRAESVITIDRKAPTVEIRADKNKVVKGDEIIYEFIWSEAVTGFKVEDITVANGERDEKLTGSGNYYTLVVTPNGSNDVEVSVDENTCTDVAGNNNIASSKHVIAVVPTVTITANKSNPTNANEITYTFTWSETVTGFDISDIILPKGSTGTLNGNTMTVKYSSIIPLGNEGEVTVAVKENAAQDSNGNTNAYSSLTTKIDRIAPTVEIRADKNKVEKDDEITYEFIWSEAVKDFDAEKISIVNGIVKDGTLNSSGLVVKVPNDTNPNDIEVTIQAGACTDEAGNDNIASSKHVIAVVPTVTIEATPNTNPTNESEIEYKFTWSETVTGFDISDIILPNGVTGTLNGNTMTVNYSSIIPLGNEGEVTVAVKENAAQDSNGNTNAYSSLTTKIDRIAPIFVRLEAHTVTGISLNKDVDTVKQYYKAGDTVKIIATFTENIEKSTVPSLALQFSESGNAKNNITSEKKGNQITYTYVIKNGDTGLLSVKGFSGEVKDDAGNITKVSTTNLEGNKIIADTTAPSLKELNIVSPASGTYKAGTPIEIHAVYDEEVYALTNNEIKNITSGLAPTLKIKFGNGQEREATFNGYVGEDKTKLKYTISISNEENGALSITSYTNKQNVIVCDIAGNEASLNKNQTGNEIIADTIRPSVTGVTASIIEKDTTIKGTAGDPNNTETSYYKAGEQIKITVTFSEKVSSATLHPVILVGFSEIEGLEPIEYSNQAYESDWNVDSETVEFTYTIKEGDNGYLWVKVPEDQFQDIAGNKNTAKAAEEKKNIYADTIIPTLTIYKDVETTQNGQKITVEATFSENVYNLSDGTRITLTEEEAPLIIYGFGSATGNLEENASNVKDNVITYVITKENTISGEFYHAYFKGNLYDRAGNECFTNNVDTIAPELKSVVITSNAGSYAPYCKEGKEIYVIATFDEPIANENMKMEATIGGKDIPVLDGVIVEENTRQIKFTYKVKAGDTGRFEIKDICGEPATADKDDYGWVRDEHGNQKNIYSLPSGIISGEAIADTTRPFIESVTVNTKVENENVVLAEYNKQEAKVEFGRTNANEIEYVVKFSELVRIIDGYGIKLYNGEKVEILNNDSNHDGYYDEITIKAKTTIEGVQSLIISDNAIEDRAGNTNLLERFNILTTDFTLPTVRFISEYNGGIYVLPTNIGKIEIRPNVEISEDIYSIEYAWDNEEEYKTINNYSSSSDIAIPTKTFTAAGTYKLNIRVTDLAGNVAITSKTYRVINSNINITLSTEEYTNKNITATVIFSEGLTDNRKVTFKADGSEEIIELQAIGLDENGNSKYTIEKNGRIYAEATDKVGNKISYMYANENGHPISKIDTEKPTIEIELKNANLIIGTGEDYATIKTGVKVEDNNNGTQTKFAFLQENIDIYNITSEQKARISNNLDREAKIENAESTKDKNPYYLYVLATDIAGNEKIEKAGPFTVIDANNERKDEEGNAVPTEIEISKLIDFKQEGKHVGISYNNFGEEEGFLDIIKEKSITLTNSRDGDIDYENYSYVDVNGATTITVIGTDACGNKVIVTYEVTKESLTGPEIRIVGNSKEWTNSNITLEVYCYEELLTLTVNGTDILSQEPGVNSKYIVKENGDYEFVATDIFGNTTKEIIKVDKIDKVDPEIDMEETTIEGNTIDIEATDNLSGISEYAISTTTELPAEWSTNKVIKTTEDGTFYIWAKDNAGNVGRAEEVVVVDTTAPEVIFNYTSLIETIGNEIESDVIVNEDAIISYSWDNETWISSEEYVRTQKVINTPTEPGTYTLYVKATDNVGNTSEVHTLQFRIIPEEIEQKIPEIIFEDLPTIQVDGVKYVKIAADMTSDVITGKMNIEKLCGKTPEYIKLTEDGRLRTGSEITIDGETKYIIVVNGDVNCDGKVEPIDVTLANRIRLNKVAAKTIQKLAADFDLDGNVKAIDITMINRYRLGKIRGI